jgi:Calpain family cysteine protease
MLIPRENGPFTFITTNTCQLFKTTKCPKRIPIRRRYWERTRDKNYHRPCVPGAAWEFAICPVAKSLEMSILPIFAKEKWEIVGIKRLFRKTKRIDDMPLDDGSVNFYTITLWDLMTWKEVDIVIDESLCASKRDPGQLLASKPSEDGELWVPYLEKALAIHCGGWDEITGGQCTHGWSLMTGCREQYTIMRDPKTKKFFCMAKINPATRQWSKHFNSPKRGTGGMWRCRWPEVGGGGDENLDLTENELYERMCAWDRADFIVAAGTKGTSDKSKSGGMVDNHAYSVIDCHPRVAGTKIDLLKVRNPWGQGEIENGDFDDDGPGWDKYPHIKAELNPVVADDGIFYLTKKEFFQFFDHLYVSAKSMTAFKED